MNELIPYFSFYNKDDIGFSWLDILLIMIRHAIAIRSCNCIIVLVYNCTIILLQVTITCEKLCYPLR